MNILMCTNTFFPHVGGVARSVHGTTEELRKRGHRVVVFAPQFEGAADNELDVIRLPAVQNFNGSDFSVTIAPTIVAAALPSDFTPDVVHAHHPFLLGETALRLAALFEVPLVFTHHTMYERYTHYVPGDSRLLKRFVMELATGYANLCDSVIAPSESIRQVLMRRGVETAITVVPTGVPLSMFAGGDGESFRVKHEIPKEAFVAGHVGRLAEEKNLAFLSEAMAAFLRKNTRAYLLVVGDGPHRPQMEQKFSRAGLSGRVRFAGSCQGEELAGAYRAMDLFVFASLSETQGLVVAESMAAGVPVVALDANGVREVVRDGKNGRLLESHRASDFASAVEKIARASPDERDAMKREALNTARMFSDVHCADLLVELYQDTVRQGRVSRAVEGSPWLSAVQVLDAEWQVWANRAKAAVAALSDRRIWPLRAWRRLNVLVRRYLPLFSRSHWLQRTLGLASFDEPPTEPGLVLIQIDGLSFRQLEAALAARRMPFLKSLLRNRNYSLHSFYSGLPATTPAVQGELFYGVPQAVPAFGYLERSTRKFRRMIEMSDACAVERRLARSGGDALLEGGAVFSDIYSGGSKEPAFCAVSWGLAGFVERLTKRARLFFVLAYLPSFVRIGFLAVVELALALLDSLRGIVEKGQIWAELRFIVPRVAISGMLRELLVIAAALSVRRGLPIVHVNFLGYDEQAHRRGPSAAFAHWTLRGIDEAIKKISASAARSPKRLYEVWIYSDHGQIASIPYHSPDGGTLEAAVVRACRNAFKVILQPETRNESLERSRWTFAPRNPRPEEPSVDDDEAALCALGPLGHFYFPKKYAALPPRELARRLVAEEGVPLVILPLAEGRAEAHTANETFILPERGVDLFGEEHPYAREVGKDLASLAHHPDAGDLILSGWRKGQKSLTFVGENGAHAGPSREEVQAFALAPIHALEGHESGVLRPLDLRRAVQRYMDVDWSDEVPRPASGKTLRVMSYNVHACVGTDGQLSHERIVRVIARYNPDIVALQELDVTCDRSFQADQARIIAHRLGMRVLFNCAKSSESEQFGDAILCRLPLTLVKAAPLPGIPGRTRREPRGAIVAKVEASRRTLTVLNTHFGLNPSERVRQVDALLGPSWLGSNGALNSDVIVCGDFNALPGSYPYRRLTEVLRDTQRGIKGHRARRTWNSIMPLTRIDYIFVSPNLRVENAAVPRTALTRVASDHLPLIVDLSIE